MRHNKGMTDSRLSLRPDARLVRLHAQRGDPQTRLSAALAALEGADWGLLFPDMAALAQQLSALLGSGTLRVDHRIRVNRDALGAAGLAVAPLDGEWRGSKAVWLFEPEVSDFERAGRAGVRVIVDSTLAPGGQWLQGGAHLTAYRNSVTLTGHTDAPLTALFGLGGTPEAVGSGPSDLSVALALRDVATLPLRLARAARTVTQLAERLGGAAQLAGPTALLLAPDAAPNTPNPLGGVMAAARSIQGGVLLTPGLEDTDTTLALLRGEDVALASVATAPRDEQRKWHSQPPREQPREQRGQNEPRLNEPRQNDQRSNDQRPNEQRQGRDHQGRENQNRRDSNSRDGGRRDNRDQRRGDRPSNPNTPDVPERFTFDAPNHVDAEPLFPVPVPTEETWEPEIVFSDIAQEQVRLPTPVSSGPDAPNLGDHLPDVLHQPSHLAAADEPHAPAQPDPAPEPTPALTPDLPKTDGKEDPAANLTEEQAAIYARLRDWRNTEAKRQDISRFIIASNATLAEIAKRVPYTPADLKAVKGMGPERMKKYGEKILEVVRG